jgi:ubiquinone/menaquinone biosynthesis C-methylase UbiE
MIDTTAGEAYEKFMVPGMFRHWAERLVQTAAPRPGEHVLDVACGTGVVARAVAPLVGAKGRVAGLDIDAGVIEVARRLSAGSVPAIEWHCASALEMPFGPGEFDLCLCQQGIQFFPDRIRGLREMRRVLKSNGRLVAALWAPLETNKGHHVLVETLERLGVDAAAAKRACSFSDTEAIRAAAKEAGFSGIDLRTEDGVSHFDSMKGFLDAMTYGSPSTRHAIALLDDAGRRKFTEAVTAGLERYVSGGELQYPMQTHVFVATP